MKTFQMTVLILLLISSVSKAQDSYKKRYYVHDSIHYIEKFHSQKTKNKEPVKLKIPLQMTGGTIDTTILKIASSNQGLSSNVAFGEKKDSDKLFINPWLVKGEKDYILRDTVYFYQLQNRQSVKLKFTQLTLSALSVPLKARFGKNKTEFSTGLNLGALIGYTCGKTNFVHTKGLENSTYDTQFTFGIFLGADKLEFSFKGENDEEVKVKSAFITTGLGIMYSYQKFTFGVTGGIDSGLGENSSKWDYNTRPWLGITLGYSLFSF